MAAEDEATIDFPVVPEDDPTVDYAEKPRAVAGSRSEYKVCPA